MPRQRTSMPARRPSDTSSSSRASFHTAHETRGSVYPGMQARASGGNESELPRNSRNGLSDIIEIARHDDGSETSRRPSRRHPGILPWISDAGESDSGYGSRTGRSYPSQTGLSDYSTNSLEPWDSISNQGSNPSDSIYIPPNLSLRRYCRTHRCYSEDDNCDPRRCTYFMTTGSDIFRAPHAHSAISGDQNYSCQFSDSCYEGPRTPRSYGGSDTSFPHDDGDGEPSTPRGYSHCGINYRHDIDDDEEEEPFTPRVFSGRRTSFRSDDDDDDDDQRALIPRPTVSVACTLATTTIATQIISVVAIAVTRFWRWKVKSFALVIVSL